MDPPSPNKYSRQDDYQFSYNQNDPSSLIMTKKAKLIYQSLFKQGTYVWVIEDTQQLEFQPSQIEKRSQVKINFVKKRADLKQYGKQDGEIVMICHVSLFDEVLDSHDHDYAVMDRINLIMFYGNRRGITKQKEGHLSNRANIQFFHSEQKLLEQISESKKYHATGNFVNFISLDNQKMDSNILVSTMFAMIRHSANVQQIMKKFKQSAFQCYGKQYTQDIQQLYHQYLNNKELKENKAVHWYTKESFLYRFINRMLRISKNPTCIYVIQPIFKDLFNDIKNLYQQHQKKGYEEFTCYRGAEITKNEIQFFKEKKDEYIQNLGFLSTSRKESTAKRFVKNVMFIISVENTERKPQLDYGFADVNDYSSEKEFEIIFNPLNSFKVMNFEQFEPDQYKITLKYGEMARVAVCQKNMLKQNQLKWEFLALHQTRLSISYQHMGYVLLYDQINLEGSQFYLKKFLNIAKNSHLYDDLANGHNMKGRFAMNKGDYKTAKIQYHECLKIYEKNLSNSKDEESGDKKNHDKKKNYNLSTALNNLGTCYHNLGQYQEALKYYRRCENIYLQFETKKSTYANLIHNIGECLNQLGQYQKAEHLFQKCLKIWRQIYGENYIQYVHTLNSLGKCYNEMGQYKKAEECYLRSENIYRQSFGQNHPTYANALNSLGLHYDKLGQYQKAIGYYEKSEQIMKKIVGENHPDYALRLNNLGMSYLNLGQIQRAIQYFEKCQKIRRQSIGENHPDYAMTINNLGSAFWNLGQFKRSLEYSEKCQKIWRKTIGQDHPNQTVNTFYCFNFLN